MACHHSKTWLIRSNFWTIISFGSKMLQRLPVLKVQMLRQSHRFHRTLKDLVMELVTTTISAPATTNLKARVWHWVARIRRPRMWAVGVSSRHRKRLRGSSRLRTSREWANLRHRGRERVKYLQTMWLCKKMRMGTWLWKSYRNDSLGLRQRVRRKSRRIWVKRILNNLFLRINN